MNKIGNRYYRLEIRDRLERIGITTAYQLWTTLGGSKETSYELWNGVTKQVKFETLANLCEILTCEPSDVIIRVDKLGRRRKQGK